jgi:hypothetical protein
MCSNNGITIQVLLFTVLKMVPLFTYLIVLLGRILDRRERERETEREIESLSSLYTGEK